MSVAPPMSSTATHAQNIGSPGRPVDAMNSAVRANPKSF
jgi:hypothetical protein